jgi:hypothetical protein
MSGQTIHMSLSVRGALNWDKKRFKDACKWITKKDGTPFSPSGLREMFMDLLSEGKEVIPIGDCDNFDFKTGCKGHPCDSV